MALPTPRPEARLHAGWQYGDTGIWSKGSVRLSCTQAAGRQGTDCLSRWPQDGSVAGTSPGASGTLLAYRRRDLDGRNAGLGAARWQQPQFKAQAQAQARRLSLDVHWQGRSGCQAVQPFKAWPEAVLRLSCIVVPASHESPVPPVFNPLTFPVSRRGKQSTRRVETCF